MEFNTSSAFAEEISEELLHRTGLVYSTGNTDHAIGCFELPQVIESTDGKALIETEADLRQVFENVMAYFRKNDVTEIVRTAIKAEFISPITVGATHVSRLIKSDGSLYRAPYPTYSLLRRGRTGWRVASSAYAILDSPEHSRALLVQPKPNDVLSMGRTG